MLDQGPGCRSRQRFVCAAAERRCIQPRLGQHPCGYAHVAPGAAVGCAAERNFGRTEAEPLGCAGFDERQALDRLDRRSGEHGPMHLAHGERQPSIRTRDGDGATVPALDALPAQHLHKNRIGHPALQSAVPITSSNPQPMSIIPHGAR